VYYRGRAHLVRSAAPVGQDAITLVDVAGQDVQAKKSEVSSTRTGTPAAPAAFAFGGCPGKDEATAERSKDINRCYEKIARKYKSSLAKLQKAVDRAKGDAKREKAEEKLAAKVDKQKAEEAKKCEPLKQQAEEEGRAAYRDIVELTDQGTPAAALDRAGMMQALERANPSL
jgi:hypothetical protein